MAHGHRQHLDETPRPHAHSRLGPRRHPAHQHPHHPRRPRRRHRLRPRLRPRRPAAPAVPGALTHTTAPEIAAAILSTPADTHIQTQPAADIWSLGASLFWCWTGHRPVPYDDTTDRMEKLAVIAKATTTTALRNVRPWPFPELEDTVTACLAPDPADRPTAKELTTAW
ncbi:hypothetical protein [Streptomyces platensis]|uniref:hypothetical protein n=1 Tax=Streptomyces platensis TaxID=58346 RepID=UPI001F31B890|nr:hypothetical protein [Streptomyces platensis]